MLNHLSIYSPLRYSEKINLKTLHSILNKKKFNIGTPKVAVFQTFECK
jgi:hypothetical protein